VWSTVWSRRVKHDRARCIVGSAALATRERDPASRARGTRDRHRAPAQSPERASRVDREARPIRRRGHEPVVLTQCATIDDYAPKPQFPRISPFPAVRARAARGRAAARGRRRRSVHGFTMSLSSNFMSNFTPITPRFACLGLCPRHMRCGVPLPDAGSRLPLRGARRVVTLILTYLLSNLLTSLTLNT
jgi:hypothetical protein